MVKSRFAIITHILTHMYLYKNQWVSSEMIADSLNINPVLVRKELAVLRKHEIISCKEGKGGGSKLAKPASEITLGLVFNLIKEQHIFSFAKNEPCPECVVGQQFNQNLKPIFENVDQAVFNELNQITLETFGSQFVI